MTVIYPPAFSLAESRERRRRQRRASPFACVLLLVLSISNVGAESFRLELGRLDHPLFTLQGLTIIVGREGEGANVHVSRVALGERRWSDLALRCGDFRLAEGEIRCVAGVLRVPGLFEQARFAFEYDQKSRRGSFRLDADTGESVRGSLAADGKLDADLVNLDLGRAVAWLPRLAEWRPGALFSGKLSYRPGVHGGSLAVSGQLVDGSFSSADGLNAAEGLTIDLDLGATAVTAGWDWHSSFAWSGGEAYLHPVYLSSGVRMRARGRLRPDLVVFDQATLELAGVRTIEATAELRLDPFLLERAALTVADADLAVIGPTYLAPLVAPARPDTLTFSGLVSAGIRIERDAVVALDAALHGVALEFDDGQLGFGPITGAVPWRSDTVDSASLSVGGGHWKQLTFGPFEVDARLGGRSLDIARLAIPVLDGRLVFSDLALHRGLAGWSGRGSLVVEPIAMDLLTGALDLPEMAGVLSASLPGLRVAPGEVRLDGAMVISVFDGHVKVTDLQLLEPFGIAAHLYADVAARNINLAQLTDTFAFGSMSGFVDVDVQGLELVRWQPVRFDANLRSSPGRYERRISQRAVQNLSALGGAGASAVIQRGFLGFFESFGYREIGLSCKLSDGVCVMNGLERRAPEGGFVIVRGGGIPALNVIGYNRRVDWNELLDRLRRVIESNEPPVIE